MSDDGKLLSKSVYSGPIRVQVGDRTLLPITHVGHTIVHTSHKPLHLKHVLHILTFYDNLLSLKQLYHDNNCVIVFDGTSACIKDKTTCEVLMQASTASSVHPLHISVVHPILLMLL